MLYRNIILTSAIFFSFFLQSVFAGNEFEEYLIGNREAIEQAHAPVQRKLQQLTILKQNIKNALNGFKPNEASFAQTQLIANYKINFDEVVDQFEELHFQYVTHTVAPIAKQYSWAIPNDAAIETIKKYGPILELAAGSGLWASLLDAAGVDIVSYDDFSWIKKGIHLPSLRFNVKKARGFDMFKEDQNQNRTLLISWPPLDRFAYGALSRFQGTTFIYIGELPRKEAVTAPPMGEAKFFRYIQLNFDLKETTEIPNWPGFSDKLYVFTRKKN